jgi:hypothetical protein
MFAARWDDGIGSAMGVSDRSTSTFSGKGVSSCYGEHGTLPATLWSGGYEITLLVSFEHACAARV